MSVADLHSANNKLNKENSLTEGGAVVNGRGDNPNMHDILTGSQADGTAFAGAEDRTCGNRTSTAKAAPRSAIMTARVAAPTRPHGTPLIDLAAAAKAA